MSKPTRFVFASDSHGDHADTKALAALYAFCLDFKPTVRIAGGDHFDFRSLRKGKDDTENNESLNEDLAAGFDFFARYRPTVYLWGNHEARLDAHIRSSGSAMFREACEGIKDKVNAHARKCGAKVILPYNAKKGVYRLGDRGQIAAVHGYSFGLNATKEMGLHYAARGGALIHGHTHSVEQVALRREGGGAAFSAGWLGLNDSMDYSATRLATARHSNAFVAGWVDGDDWKVFIVEPTAGRWTWPSDFKTFYPR